MTTSRLLLRLAELMVKPSVSSRWVLLGAVLLEMTVIGLGVAGPYALKMVIDALDLRAGAPAPAVMAILLFVICWATAPIIESLRLACTAIVIDALARRMTLDALEAVLPAITAARDVESGRVAGMLERLPYSLTLVVEGLVWRIAPVILQSVVSMLIIVSLVPARHGLILGLTLAAFVTATWVGGIRHRIHADSTNIAASGASQIFSDLLRNARRVVLNGALDRELGHAGGALITKRMAAGAMYRSLVNISALQFGSFGLGLLVLLLLAGHDVSAGRISIGAFVLLQTYALRLTLPLSSFGYILAQAGVALANIRDVLTLQVPMTEEALPGQVKAGAGTVSLRAVSFDYGVGIAALSDISVEIAPGHLVVIAGANGSGKSTLAQVIAGVLPPASGTVEIAGMDLAAIPWRERHRLVLYTPQYIGLFNRSLRENVLYPPTSQEASDVENLLQAWRFHEAGKGIDFEMALGEQGRRLSGGQIQKLELARLAGVSVPVLILDESTSALDPRSEAEAISTLTRRKGARTTLVMITHREGVAQQADRVLFMQEGRLADSGTHSQLLNRCLAYRQLWSVPNHDTEA